MRIVDYSIAKVTKPEQYAVRFKIQGGGWTRLVRLKRADGSRLAPTVLTGKHTDEPDNVQADIRRAVLVLLQDMIKNDTMIATRSKYGTCGAAMESYLQWYAVNRRAKSSVKSIGGKFIERFGNVSLTRLNRQLVDEWIESMIGEGMAYDTIRLRIMIGNSMINWLSNNGDWQRQNPFTGRLKEYMNRFPAAAPERSTISDEEYERLLLCATGDEFRAARVFIQTSRMTGLRPSEVKRLNVKHLDHSALTWDVLVSKTRGRPFFRRIAIPAQLSAFIVNEKITGQLPTSNLKRQYAKLREISGVDVDPKIFRKDFARRMEQAGAGHDIINVHQGRAQSGILIEHYLTDPDRAVSVCRKFVDAMFSSTAIRRVK